ncbi:MAG TPA: biotin/lipoyl-binding protein, partial [Candidatus Nitrosotalea sp.]|nr:biotin/lipoyl-binding protein [Candidatus Nitrosotalea sp.]
MRSGRRTVVIAAGAAIVVALLVLVVATHRPARQVAVVSVNYAPFTIALPESGVIQYPQIQTMSSRIAGNVGRINVKTGQRVVAGQLLATIENPQVLSNAASSAAAYRSASARAQSAEVTGGSNLAQAQANLETARTRLAQAQQDLANGLQPGLGYGQNTAAQQRAA